jgi:hypothetical protein
VVGAGGGWLGGWGDSLSRPGVVTDADCNHHSLSASCDAVRMSACHPLNRTSPSDRRAMRSDPSRVLDAALTVSLRLERHGSSAHHTTRSDSCVCRAQPSQPTSRRCSYPTDSPSELTRAEGEDRPADLSLHFFSAAVPPARPGPARPAGFAPSFTLRPGSATWCDYASAVHVPRVRALRRFTRGPYERAEPSQVRALRRLRPRPAYERRRPAVLLETEVLRKGERGQSNQGVLRAHISPPNLSSA